MANYKGGLLLAICCGMLFGLTCQAEAGQELLAVKTDIIPEIDGVGSDAPWAMAKPVIVHEPIADIDITLKAVHNNETLFLLATFADTEENRQHRTLRWNEKLKAYQNGPEREDVFVLKWSMSNYPTKLSLQENAPYVADIWFWKAMRTDHAGFADDKIQRYSASKSKKSKTLISENQHIFYLTREGDAGEPAYSTSLVPGYQGDRLPKYNMKQPAGSRADIRAKGVWHDGRWTIEFARKLITGHGDDVQFLLDGQYPFAISRYEIAGRSPEPESEQPLYGAGEVGEIIMLLFDK